MQNFTVKQADFTIDLRLERPAFALLGAPSHRLLQLIYEHFERYGVTANDITYGNVGSLGDRHVLIFVPRISSGVKLSVSKIELGFNDLRKVSLAEIQAAVIVAAGSLIQVDPTTKVIEYALTLNVHGLLEGSSVVDFIGGYFGSRPGGLGPSTGSATGFYYGTEGSRTQLAIIMDGSVPVEGGLYVRLTTAFDARELGAGNLVNAGWGEFRKAFAAVKLVPDILALGSKG